MPAERLDMRKVREIMRLKFGAGLSHKAIGRSLGIATSTVRLKLQRAAEPGLSWSLPDDLTDATLEERRYGTAGTKLGHRRLVEPDWAAVHRELKRNKHVTLSVLWEEYHAEQPDGYRYSRWCDLYRRWEARLPVTMRQSHVGGEKLSVDYARDKVPVIIDRLTGEIRMAEIFVAALGASSFTYAEATWTQGLADWLSAMSAHWRRSAAVRGCWYRTTRRWW